MKIIMPVLSSLVGLFQFDTHGSGSVRIPNFGPIGSGSFHRQPKIERKTFFSTVLWHLYDFLYLKIDVKKYPSSGKKTFFLLAFWRSLTKRIRNSGFCISFFSIPDPEQCCEISASLHGRLYLWLCWYGGDRGAQAQLRTFGLANQKVCHSTFTVVKRWF
jgi:hypothetical protein